MEVNIHEAKTHFSRLIQRVEAGEEITISRAGKPVAKLIAVGPKRGTRPMGLDRGRMWMAPDFDAPDPELEALFYEAPITTDSSNQRKRKKK
ncbi:MAG TPA: type II toxin-antitoxin system Phd/YefM family antitoxin [Terriglobales bacterium]|nr:type II toxin-antitoxin system Phd/YefM family antitoxin [Terriglobales bacterium]